MGCHMVPLYGTIVHRHNLLETVLLGKNTYLIWQGAWHIVFSRLIPFEIEGIWIYSKGHNMAVCMSLYCKCQHTASDAINQKFPHTGPGSWDLSVFWLGTPYCRVALIVTQVVFEIEETLWPLVIYFFWRGEGETNKLIRALQVK